MRQALGSLEHELTLFLWRMRYLSFQSIPADSVLDGYTYPLLLLLHSSGPKRVGEVARIVHVDKSTASRHLARLQAAGLVEPVVDPADRRSALLRVTAAGKAQLEGVRQARTEPLRRIFATWSAEDRDTFTRLLGRLNADLEKVVDLK